MFLRHLSRFGNTTLIFLLSRKGTAEIMLRDIQDQREMGKRASYDSLGDPCDVRTWEKFEDWLRKERDREAT